MDLPWEFGPDFLAWQALVVRTGPTTVIVAEVRQGTPFEERAGGPVDRGVLLYTVDTGIAQSQIRVHDAHPDAGPDAPSDGYRFDDALFGLADGQVAEYRDPRGRLSVRVLNRAGGAYTVQVVLR